MKKILAVLILAAGALPMTLRVPGPPPSVEVAQAANSGRCIWHGETGGFLNSQQAPGLRHALLVVSAPAPTIPQPHHSGGQERNRDLNMPGLCGSNGQEIPVAARHRHRFAGGV
jgi:hypothetical protein